MSSLYLTIAAAPLASKGSIFEGQINSLKPYPDLFIRIKYPKTILGLILSFPLKKNYVSSVVSDILRYKQKSLVLYIIGLRL